MLTIFLSLHWICYNIAAFFYVLFCFVFACTAHRILASWPEIEPVSPALKGKVLTTEPPGKSQAKEFLELTCSILVLFLVLLYEIFVLSLSHVPCRKLLKPLDSLEWQRECLLYANEVTGGEGNRTPLQYSCLENPMDRGAWWAAVHGVARSWTRLTDFTFTFHFSCIWEGNGNPLQCSCLESPRGGGTWWAAVYGVTQSQTRLKRLSSSSSCRGDWWLDIPG